MRGISIDAVRWLIRVQSGKSPIITQPYGVLFTEESPEFCFNSRSSYAIPRLYQYGRAIPLDGRQVGHLYLMFSTSSYSFHHPTRWVDGRVTEAGCHGAECWRCEAWNGASNVQPSAPSSALLDEWTARRVTSVLGATTSRPASRKP